ncbi:TPA: hypothetical protein ACH3X2_005253 [Trebouxia sp. C0005]
MKEGQQGGSGGPAAPSEQVHPPSPQQRHQSEAAAWRANRRDVLCSRQADLACSVAAIPTGRSQAAAWEAAHTAAVQAIAAQ